MPFKDLREYIARLEYEGEVQRIGEEVQPVLEVGAILRRSYDLGVPGPLFLNLRGYPGHRILGAPIGLSRKRGRPFARLAISMDMKPESKLIEIVEEYLKRITRPLRPVIVKYGPCKENILTGDAIDLQAFPAPVLHRDDGGPYIGTWHTNIIKDPDTEDRSWGLDRLMIHSKKTMGGLFLPGQSPGCHYYAKYEPHSRSMEFAVAIGAEPVTPWVAATRFPPNVSRVEIIGAIRGAPLELIKCETVDLEVPATSEIVIEGFVPPHERRKEGPFGEQAGFMASSRAARPVYHVTAITHRDHPILPVAIDDLAVSHSLTKAAEVLAEIRCRGFPARSVYCQPEAEIASNSSFDSLWPKEVQQKIVRNWRAYGYPEEASE